MKAHGRESQLNVMLRIIVIDDNLDWCNTMKRMITGLQHTLDIAQTVEEAQRQIEQAELRDEHYAIAIIDMNFKEGDNEILAGIDLIDDIKRNHPYIACVVASGERASPDYVLDLRDEHQLDYYLQKERISRDKVKKAIERCRERLGAMWAEYLPQSPASSAGAQQSSPPPPHPVREHPAGEPPKPPLQDSIRVQLDFQVAPGGPTITWRAPLIGRVMTRLVEPYTPDELPLVIRALNVLQYPDYPHPVNDAERRSFTFTDVQQDHLAGLGLWRGERVAADAAELIGQALYQALGPDGQDLLRTISNAGIFGGNTASYILRFPPDGIRLAALPWELLWDRAKNRAVLIRGNQIDSCERYLDLDVALPPPIRGGQKLHLLALSPQYGIPGSLREQERRVRRDIWDRLRDNGRITYGEVSPLTMSDLNNYLDQLSQRPDIVHYFGHGTFLNGEGYLYFDDGSGGRDLVSAKRLAAALGDVRLLVIHACQSAAVAADSGLLTGVAPALSTVTGAVVAMQLTVRTESALRFMCILYEQLLGRGQSLQEAVARGRHRLFTEAADGASWYVPALYIRSRDQQPIYFTS